MNKVNKRASIIIVITICIFALTACADMRRLSTSATTLGGAAGGAFIGQMIGHNTEATLIGAAIGTMLGYIVGNEMDKFDRQQLNESLERGPSGLTKVWVNPDTHNEYWVTPEPVYKKPVPRRHRRQYRRQAQRQPYREPPPQKICRKAEIIAIIDGQRERTYTTACRDNNGDWQLQ